MATSLIVNLIQILPHVFTLVGRMSYNQSPQVHSLEVLSLGEVSAN